MGFTITDSDGNITKEVWTCTECTYLSTKRHFRSGEDGPNCVMCNAPAKKQRTISKQAGMSAFKYRMLLDYLEDEVTGVGSGTVSSIESHFESGDDFIDAAEAAYQDREWDALSCVDGVGKSTAESIALGLAEREGWEDGKAEMKFNL